MSYTPALPPALVRVNRDDVFIAKLERLVSQFGDMLAEAKDKLERRGIVPSVVAAL